MNRGIFFLVATAAIAGAIGWYQYDIEQVRQSGFVFGNELQQIQEDVKFLQNSFYTSIESWEEGAISREELLDQLATHLAEFEKVIAKYNTLEPPEGFAGAVELFRLSSQAQMESDIHYVQWLSTGDQTAKTRSDLQLEESFNMEMAALAEFNKARDGSAP